MPNHSYRRLVTVQIGVTVGFDSDTEMDEAAQKTFAETVAADIFTTSAMERRHPVGEPSPLGKVLLNKDAAVVPTELAAKLVLVDDEGDWS